MGELRVEHPLFLAFLLVIGENPVVSFAAPQDRVNRGVERVHAVIRFTGSSIQPFDITVWSGNVAVGAGCNVDDDFSICFHENSLFETNGGYAQQALNSLVNGITAQVEPIV